MKKDEIKNLRKRFKMTQKQFADLLGVKQGTVARWETGVFEPKGISLKVLSRLRESGCEEIKL